MTFKSLLLSAALLALPMTAAAQDSGEITIIHAGTLLAVPGEAPTTDQSIVITDGVITSIEDGFISYADADIIDLSDDFVLPGLIDSHVHLLFEFSPTVRLDGVTKNEGDITIDGVAHARRTLMAGFTAVQDVGGSYEIFALRDGINAGKIPGPHIKASGPALSPTGGHADTHGYRYDILEMFHSPSVCDGADDCRRAARAAIKAGADVIKITATGGVLSNTAAGTSQQFFEDELEAIVDSAAKMGRNVTAHAHGKDGIEAALRAGVKSIEHGTYLDEETVALFIEYDAVLVPTVLAGMTVMGWAEQDGFLPPASRQKALEVGPRMLEMLRIAHEGGVTIAFGTDTGVSAHGDNAQEFIYMVQAGMSEMEALESATVIAAEHIGMGNQIGSIEVGKQADIIAVDGNPLDDISEMLDVDFVMKGGVVYKSE